MTEIRRRRRRRRAASHHRARRLFSIRFVQVTRGDEVNEVSFSFFSHLFFIESEPNEIGI